MEISTTTIQPTVILKPGKSVIGAFFLALFLGPLGLTYANMLGGIILMIVFMIAVAVKNGFILAFLLWIAGAVWAIALANKHNKKIFRYYGIDFCAKKKKES
ncbi:MAG: hypothetical protein A2X77_04520 [Gammaproteobacteria bacterium GWE2_42_36]|nr:MAG: hypothetical protein A2X77_04520 [Gammaproteobacteria bacterium GWE2_42_36]HCU05410.1 hypothetical protein [Coxiellaceae bacterium]